MIKSTSILYVTDYLPMKNVVYCKTHVLIVTPDLEEGYTLIRKSAIELKESDIVLLSESTKLYTILMCKKEK